ncbi:MAG: hypoxanthine phosphoribosyltransferase [Oscillospiraceae bacterium]|jgi:hypoxanthine phosphoribosyltransferase|nr:hypoxanthine phosphoribosyltransferase [Oscillospiraceae bacterium]
MTEDILKILLTKEQLEARVKELGRELTERFAGGEPLFIGVLKGSFIFMADLIRNVKLKCAMDFMAVSSYGRETSTSGAVKINKDLNEDISGRHVIIVEDILDSGVTLNYLCGYLRNRKPASITLVALLDKPARRRAAIRADFIGFEVPDEFVVGYGLDYAERYRNLPFVGILKPEVYAN